MQNLKEKLEFVYEKYNKKEFVNPDPLLFLYNYPDFKDMEIAGLIASALAYGRVGKIMEAVEKVLDVFGKSLKENLLNSTDRFIEESFENFKYRFTDKKDIVPFLIGIKNTVLKYGSLENAFYYFFHDYKTPKVRKIDKLKQRNKLLSALNLFVAEILEHPDIVNSLLPMPSRGSASKRLFLYLRWMIRKDDVDPGCWSKKISASEIFVPLDTHMAFLSKKLGFLNTKVVNLKSVLRVTEEFKKINPKDPVKYDFALTRFGIRDDMSFDDFFLK